MKTVIIRVDVDVQNDSLIANKLRRKSGCSHIMEVMELAHKYDVKLVWSLRSDVLPHKMLIQTIQDMKHEIQLHADSLLPDNMKKEKVKLEQHIESEVLGEASSETKP